MRRARVASSPLGEKLRVFARGYAAAGQKERAEGLMQAADAVDAELAGTTTGLVDDPLVKVLLEIVRALTVASERITEAAADLTSVAADSAASEKVVRTVKGPPIPKALGTGRRAARKAAGHQSGEHRILVAAAQHADGVTRQQLTVLIGLKQSTRNAYIQRLRERGLLSDTDRVRVTDAGRAELGPSFEPLPTGRNLVKKLRAELPEGEWRVLEALLARSPLTRDEVSERTGYDKASTRNAYIQRLRARELIYVEGELLYPDEQLTEDRDG